MSIVIETGSQGVSGQAARSTKRTSIVLGWSVALAAILAVATGCASETDDGGEQEEGTASTAEAISSSQSCGGACKRMGFTCGGHVEQRKIGGPTSPTKAVCYCNYHTSTGKSCLE
jgi:hypothetical protein